MIALIPAQLGSHVPSVPRPGWNVAIRIYPSRSARHGVAATQGIHRPVDKINMTYGRRVSLESGLRLNVVRVSRATVFTQTCVAFGDLPNI